MAAPDASNQTPNTYEDNLTEMDMYIYMAGKGIFVDDDSTLSDKFDKNAKCFKNKVNKPEESKQGKSRLEKEKDLMTSGELRTKAKRGRPCAKPPTRDVLKIRRKVLFPFLFCELFH